MNAIKQPQRGTIFLEQAEVISQQAWPQQQFVLRVHAPETARRATAGSFAHLTVDPAVPMRRPLSIMRVSPSQGWVDFLYKIHGHGLQHLSTREKGDCISVLGPIGKGFSLHTDKRRPLLIGGGVGIPPMVFLAETMQQSNTDWQAVCIMGSEIPFPFKIAQSKLDFAGSQAGKLGTHPLLEKWNIPTRLSSWQNFDSTHKGFVTDLAEQYIATLSKEALNEIEIFSCGPTPMLKAVAKLANKFKVACQVSLEEFMACAVGGCAGCTVPVQTENGIAMQRVCVDGPVFEASKVFPNQV